MKQELNKYNLKSNNVSVGTLVLDGDNVVVPCYTCLDKKYQKNFQNILRKKAKNINDIDDDKDGKDLVLYDVRDKSIVKELGRALAPVRANNPKKENSNSKCEYTDPINYDEIADRLKGFGRHIANSKEKLFAAVNNYETYQVLIDELYRSVDFIQNIDKNKEYFKKKVHLTVTFLPLNQPIYALLCFGVVPSLMSDVSIVRPPTKMQDTFKKLDKVLEIKTFFPNLKVSYDDKRKFIDSFNKKDVDVVIFTGKKSNFDRIKRKLKAKLYILNGSGHNPILVAPDADIKKAVQSNVRVSMQNQGQDCAAPNVILVHKSIVDNYVNTLIKRLKRLESKVGDYKNKKNIIGPNTDPNHAKAVVDLFLQNKEYCVYGGEISPVTGMIKPAVFVKPISEGANYREFFAPVIMIHPYENEKDLKQYFLDPRYKENAMYISVFGNEPYIDELLKKGLHKKKSILRETDLHLEEKGFAEYGGQGPSASAIYYQGAYIPGATLPQRDIYKYLIN